MINQNSSFDNGETIILREFPSDLPIFLCTGYTDLRKAIVGLGIILEEDYEMDSRSRCLTLFCGRRADRFKILFFDGDGHCLLAKYFTSKRLRWPRNGGRTDGEMWYITEKQFLGLMDGKEIREDDIAEDESILEPVVNNDKLTLLKHIIRRNSIPGGFFICTGYTDMRRSIKHLASIAEDYGLNPQNGRTCFLFCGKQSDRIKALFYDGDGFLIINKKLDTGRYQWPREKDELWLVVYSQIQRLLSGETISRDQVIQIIRKA